MKIRLSLLLVLLYEASYKFFHLEFGALKFAFGIFAYVALGLIFSAYRKAKIAVRSELPFGGRLLWYLIIVWNLSLIARSIGDGAVSTLFGNPDTALAMMLPIYMVIGIRLDYLSQASKMLRHFVVVGLVLLALLFYVNDIYSLMASILIPAFFLIMLPGRRVARMVVLIGAFALLLCAFYAANRSMMLRVALSIAISYGLLSAHLLKRIPRPVLLITLIAPAIFLVYGVMSGDSVFRRLEAAGLISAGKTEKSDTRTFLYEEVFENLQSQGALIHGKGVMGKYHSEYFQSIKDGDSANRLNVEVGFLSMLLKGGAVSVILNFAILFYAAILGVYRSANKFTPKLSLLLIGHYFILFIENVPQYTIYNIMIWICIGACLSGRIRALRDADINYLFGARGRAQAPKVGSVGWPAGHIESPTPTFVRGSSKMARVARR